MSISGISSVSSAVPALPVLPAVSSASPAGAASSGFRNVIVGAVQNLDDVQSRADVLAQQAATGELRDVHDYMLAATEASVATELTVAVRNKALEAFQSIMSMPL